MNVGYYESFFKFHFNYQIFMICIHPLHEIFQYSSSGESAPLQLQQGVLPGNSHLQPKLL